MRTVIAVFMTLLAAAALATIALAQVTPPVPVPVPHILQKGDPLPPPDVLRKQVAEQERRANAADAAIRVYIRDRHRALRDLERGSQKRRDR